MANSNERLVVILGKGDFAGKAAQYLNRDRAAPEKLEIAVPLVAQSKDGLGSAMHYYRKHPETKVTVLQAAAFDSLAQIIKDLSALRQMLIVVATPTRDQPAKALERHLRSLGAKAVVFSTSTQFMQELEHWATSLLNPSTRLTLRPKQRQDDGVTSTPPIDGKSVLDADTPSPASANAATPNDHIRELLVLARRSAVLLRAFGQDSLALAIEIEQLLASDKSPPLAAAVQSSTSTTGQTAFPPLPDPVASVITTRRRKGREKAKTAYRLANGNEIAIKGKAHNAVFAALLSRPRLKMSTRELSRMTHSKGRTQVVISNLRAQLSKQIGSEATWKWLLTGQGGYHWMGPVLAQ